LDAGAGAGTLDAVACAGALVVTLAAFGIEGGAGWRRAVEVFIVVFFEGLEAGPSFISTRRALRECNVSTDLWGSPGGCGRLSGEIPSRLDLTCVC
jgi:hypothetical protein